MKKIRLSEIGPYAGSVALMVLVTFLYFSPLIEGQRLKQQDVSQWKGMSKEISDYRARTGKEALWTNSMFGGMPAYQISVVYKGNILRFLDRAFQLYLPQPASMVVLYMLGFWLMLLVLKVDKWLALAGAFAFGFSSYFFLILEVGHNSKAHAIGYMAPVVAAVILAYQGKYLWGGILAAIFLSLELFTNHLQITYYLFLIILVLVVSQLIFALREKKVKNFLIASGVLAVAALLAVASNYNNISATYLYDKETTRGPSELTSNQHDRTSGLDKKYATDWSYGKMETFTLLVPGFSGGASQNPVGKNSATYKGFIENNVSPAQAEEYIQNMPLYWGPQPGVAGPVYVGAIVFFLFVFGLFIVNKKMRYWILAATILSVLLGWGRNLNFFTDFFLEYVPGYNKFRSVSMTLVMAEFLMPFLAILSLQQLLYGSNSKQYLLKSLYWSVGITAGLSLLFALFGSALFDFTGTNDAEYAKVYPEWLMNAIYADRVSLLRSDSFRTLLFILLAGASIWAFIKNKLKAVYVVVVLGLLTVIDLWGVNKRYLNNSDFVRKSQEENPFTLSPASEFILKDVDPDFRVFNQTVSPFNDASTSYYHKSIGGYHGAKLRRYQEIIEHHLSVGHMGVFNMLNTKYFISPNEQREPMAQINMKAMGHAWFVKHLVQVNNADEEIKALDDFSPADTAFYDKRFQEVANKPFTFDSLAIIKLVSYEPNDLVYETETKSPQMAIFSEIYYADGWNAYIDGVKSPYFRANYILRAMPVPVGNHKIEFKFEPTLYSRGEKVSYASSILLVLLCIGGVAYSVMQNRKKETPSPKA